MPQHSRAASSLSSLGDELADNKIERIAGDPLDGEQYSCLEWDIQYFSSYGINAILLKTFLAGRFGRDGYGLSLIGHMYELWSPDPLKQEDIGFCKEASRDLDNKYPAMTSRDSRQRRH